MERGNGADHEELISRIAGGRERLQALIDQIPAGILLAEAPSGRIVLGNAYVLEILRQPRLPASAAEAYVEWVAFRSDGERAESRDWPLLRALAGEEVPAEDYLHVRGDGTRAWIRVRASPIRAEAGEILGGALVVFDVDQEKRALEAERFLSEAGQVLSSSLDYEATLSTVAWLCVQTLADGCSIDMAAPDGSLRRLTVVDRFPQMEELVRELERRYPTPLDAPAGHVNAFRTGEPGLYETLPDELLRAASRDEQHFQMWKQLRMESVMCVPLIARERTLGVITLVSHSRDRRYTPADLKVGVELARRAAIAVDNARLYAEADAARKEAEAANRAKSDFLARMSHELRTPINAVMGYSEILELGIAGPLTEQQQAHLERIRASNFHLLELINEILDLAKIESGRMFVARDTSVIGEVVAEAIGLVLPLARRKAIRIENRCDPAEQTTYIGDPNRVRQILVNLLSNAIKFTGDEGRVSVSCGVTQTPDPGAELPAAELWACLAIEDTGIGIPSDQLERVFQPFVQVEGGLTRTRGGTGLGLTISRQLARLMDGDITVRSEPGRGSCFSLWLPAGAKLAERAPVATGVRAPRPALPGLATVGEALVAEVNRILGSTNARLRLDPLLTRAAELGPAELEDHQASLLADLAQALVVLGQTGGQPDLLRDGSDIQRLIAERHGRQRARHGWSEQAMHREFEILGEEIDGAVDRLFPDEPDHVRAAKVEIARMLAEAKEISLVGLRAAAAAAAED